MDAAHDTGGLVYLDHAATSPLRPEAREAMERFGGEVYANPSGSHRFARLARRAIDDAREQLADLIGCKPGEVVFTSGGTEGANTAVLGTVRRDGGTAVCPAAEHHAVLHCVEHLGGHVVPVSPRGSVDPAVLGDHLAGLDDVGVVSVMAVNNETGAVTDMAEVSQVVRARAATAVLHSDAVQAACWIDLRELWPLVDVLTLSAHKFGGPKGAGVMVVRDHVRFEPLMFGGGQERDRRSGTHNVAGIVGTAAALAVTDAHRGAENARIGALRDQLVRRIVGAIPGAVATVAHTDVVAGVGHVCIAGVESESILYLLDNDGVCVSAASACASGAMEPSHVLSAMGLDKSLIKGSLRFSLGHTTTASDIETAAASTIAAARRLLGSATS